ncbi:hypothetical protein FQN60_002856 [Etheostoma spectabile]|uniref:Uncharacterized protein n=1 Tax=Etheostoma spectabile TaxID=54343 RepID=A0A5J5CK83_9PERO|nr:hypothetical protein FQN60_002856 [Etheostoma spectabile]
MQLSRRATSQSESVRERCVCESRHRESVRSVSGPEAPDGSHTPGRKGKYAVTEALFPHELGLWKSQQSSD